METIKQILEKRNEEFAALPPNEKRVRIAQDVIARIKSHELIAKPKVWVSFLENEKTFGGYYRDESLQTVLEIENPICNVCAIGGMIVSTIANSNNFEVGEVSSYNNYDLDGEEPQEEKCIPFSTGKKVLLGIFSGEQLILIEEAFELGNGHVKFYLCDEVDNKTMSKAREFGKRYDNPTDRMLAIMENIVANNGEFTV